MRVLIADDQPGAAAFLAELVSQCRNEVVQIVYSGLDAIHAYERHRPDVVLLDHRMAKLNGVTACRHILAKDPAARIILVSGFPPGCEATDLGAVAILTKPVELHRLYEALHAAAHPKSEESSQATS
ncbi:MAG TPA: response regulator transcription factor [Candidatus Udaeobacter sp.]|jgi:two-component system response regulator AlgR|nr:response regulator transcription factor [Candidatus Udaeobacter sp.]